MPRLRTLSTIVEVHAQKNEHLMAKHLLQQILHVQKITLDRTVDKDQQDLIALDISATKRLILELDSVPQQSDVRSHQ